MNDQMHSHKMAIRWLMLFPFITLLLLTIGLSSCSKETVFSDYPADHPLFKKWPNEYYLLIDRGVFGRVVVIDNAQGLLRKVHNQWYQVASLNTPKDLINYFHDPELTPIADVIKKTLSKSATEHKPPEREDNDWWESQAIKKGLREAIDGIFTE